MKNYNLLYLPGVLLILIPIIKALVSEHRADVERKRRIAEKEAREAARREALRKAQEARAAKKAAEEAAKAAMPKRKPGRPRKNPLPAQLPANISPVQPSPAPAPAPAAPAVPAPAAPAKPPMPVGNNAFAGHTVSFTGTIPGMTRREAIEAVEKNGGKAFESMPASSTLLVVGDNPGRVKLDKADDWQIRKITVAEFRAMLSRPLTFEPDEFEAFLKAWLASKAA